MKVRFRSVVLIASVIAFVCGAGVATAGDTYPIDPPPGETGPDRVVVPNGATDGAAARQDAGIGGALALTGTQILLLVLLALALIILGAWIEWRRRQWSRG